MAKITFMITIFVIMVFSTSVFAGNLRAGEKVWKNHSCPTCHGIAGVPVIPGVPNFAKGDRMIKPDFQLMATISKGSKIMPSWKGTLSKRQMSNVVTFIRTLRKR